MAMTLDNLTRAQAESKHLKLKNSLARASAEFREQFKDEHALFRSLPDFPSRTGTPTTATPVAKGSLENARALTDDLVRLERINQCCKRVRIWRRQIANPLVQYRTQLLVGGNNGKPGAKKNDRRMHITLLMPLIVDIYEQRMHYEIEEGSSTVGIQETFPEFVVRIISQRTSNRRAAVDQLNSIISTVLQTASGSHVRVHLFGSLCGLDDQFNPPEKIKVFLHILERLHRWKATAGAAAGGGSASANTRVVDDTAMSEIVFHTIGIPQQVVQKVITELFQDDFYWNCQFWHAQCCELKVGYRWPPHAAEELQERALNLAVSSRNALLNSLRKIDGDAFLALLIHVWTDRVKEICALLEAATDAEEARSEKTLQQKQQTQDMRAKVLPLDDHEVQVFELLIDEFWNADVPWFSGKVQKKLAPIAHLRPLHELKELYATYVLNLDESRKCWSWLNNWRWETEWEWGVLHLQGHDC